MENHSFLQASAFLLNTKFSETIPTGEIYMTTHTHTRFVYAYWYTYLLAYRYA